MIVIGTDVIEGYLADHAGHKGIKAARSQFDIVTRANWRNPEDVRASYPKASILKGSRVVFNIKGQQLPTGSGRPVPGGSTRNPILRQPCRV
jgi:mRNA-degrading endonuclease HigB of HigAB toxin-antitoxin module